MTMKACVCRFRRVRSGLWENGIVVYTRVDGDDIATIITPTGEVLHDHDGARDMPVDSYDDLPRYGAFTFDPETA
jgi:hypothetical protein